MGIAVYNWRCVRCDAEVADAITMGWQTKLNKIRKQAAIAGYLQYRQDFVAHLDGEPYLVPPEEMDEAAVHVPRWKRDFGARLFFSGKTLHDYCRMHGIAPPSSAFLVSRQLAELVLQEVALPSEFFR